MASIGCMPHSTIFANCLALSPCGYTAGVGAEGNFRAALEGLAKILALQAAFFFLDGFRQHSSFGAFLKNEIVVVNVEDEIVAVLLGEGDAFVIDQAGVLEAGKSLYMLLLKKNKFAVGVLMEPWRLESTGARERSGSRRPH